MCSSDLIEEPYDHSIEQEIYDEPYMEDSKAKDKEFESYVDGIVQKEEICRNFFRISVSSGFSTSSKSTWVTEIIRGKSN